MELLAPGVPIPTTNPNSRTRPLLVTTCLLLRNRFYKTSALNVSKNRTSSAEQSRDCRSIVDSRPLLSFQSFSCNQAHLNSHLSNQTYSALNNLFRHLPSTRHFNSRPVVRITALKIPMSSGLRLIVARPDRRLYVNNF